ncbi:MAG: hypothetical protein M3457_01560 [Chloroflexota bacterium]|nr:hypothetical protein [Chloroflexota bacterium]
MATSESEQLALASASGNVGAYVTVPGASIMSALTSWSFTRVLGFQNGDHGE